MSTAPRRSPPRGSSLTEHHQQQQPPRPGWSQASAAPRSLAAARHGGALSPLPVGSAAKARSPSPAASKKKQKEKTGKHASSTAAAALAEADASASPWNARHQSLLERQSRNQLRGIINSTKDSCAVLQEHSIGLDMHALIRKDVSVLAEGQLAQMAQSYTWDDITENRVVFPLPPPSKLLASEARKMKQILRGAPVYALAPPPPAPRAPEVMRHSEPFAVTQQRLEAQLRMRGLESIKAEAAVVLAAAGVLPLVPERAQASLDKLVETFHAQTPAANLLALESGEFQPEYFPTSTPRRGVEGQGRASEKKKQRTLNRAESVPVIRGGKVPIVAAPQAAVPAAASAGARPRSGARTAASKAPVAIYTVDDVSLDALRTFNVSLRATHAREHEFAHALRANGSEKLIRDTDQRPAARPAHPLAPVKASMHGVAEEKTHALQRTFSTPLLQGSAEPLMLMPPSTQKEAAAAPYKDDSSIFDLTSVAHEAEAEQGETSPAAAAVDIAAATQLPPEEHSDRSALLQSLADDMPLRRSPDGLDGGVEDSPLPAPIIPSHEESKEQHDATAMSHRSFDVTSGPGSGSQSPGFSPSRSSRSLIIYAPGAAGTEIALPVLALEGLGSGGVSQADLDLPSIGSGFQVAPESKALKQTPFPRGMPSARSMAWAAWELGYTNPSFGTKPLSRQRLAHDSAVLAQEMYEASQRSTPFVSTSTHSAAFKAKSKALLAWAAKERRVAELVEKEAFLRAREEEEKQRYDFDSTTPRGEYLLRPETSMALSRPGESSDDEARSEVWDADDAFQVQFAPSSTTQSPFARTQSPSRMHGSASLPSVGYGSPPPRKEVPRSPPEPLRPSLEMSGVAVGPTSPQASSMLGSSQSMVNLSLGAAASGSAPRSRPTSSKQGHPPRIAPAYLSLSSADVPAMMWLQDKMRTMERNDGTSPPAEGELAASGRASRRRSRSPSRTRHRSRSPAEIAADPQSIVRPIASPLASFSPVSSPKRSSRTLVGSASEVTLDQATQQSQQSQQQQQPPRKKSVTKDYFRPGAQRSASSASLSRPRSGKLQPVARQVSQEAKEQDAPVNQTAIDVAPANSPLPSLSEAAAPPTADAAASSRPSSATAAPAPAEAARSMSNTAHALSSIDWTRDGAASSSQLLLSHGRVPSDSVVLERATPVVQVPRQHVRSFSTTPVASRVLAVANLSRGASISSLSSEASSGQPAAHLDALSEDASGESTAPASVANSPPTSHPASASLSRPVTVAVPNRLHALPVPAPLPDKSIYCKPKMQSFVNHPLHKF